jgi:GT2 family glycosyltransferase
MERAEIAPRAARAEPAGKSVLVIVLCHNGVELTMACLGSLRRQTYGGARVLVVDNASRDGTPQAVRERFPEVVVIEAGANLGFAAGNNLGLRYACAEGYTYALLLNNDTEVAADLVERLVAACEANPRVGVAGPRICYYDRPGTIWSAGGAIDWGRGTTAMLGLDMPDGPPFDQPAEVAFVTGCALLVRREVLEQVGLIDERFGMYYEEAEWCVRIGRAGWRIIYAPEGRLLHKIRPELQSLSPRVLYYMTRNRLLFLRLTGAPARAWLHAAVGQDLRTWCSWGLRRRWRGRGPQRAALRTAWRDFLLGRFGMAPQEP